MIPPGSLPPTISPCIRHAPIEYGSGGAIKHRLSLRGNRDLNHAIHMAAVAQISKPTNVGWVYYDRKQTEGKTKKEALRAENDASPTPSTGSRSRPEPSQQQLAARGTQERLRRVRGRPHVLITGSSAKLPRATPKPTPSRHTLPYFDVPKNNHLTQRGFVQGHSGKRAIWRLIWRYGRVGWDPGQECTGLHSSALNGGFLFEEGGDSLASDAEQFCDGLDGEPFSSERQRFGCSELGAGGLECGHVDRQQFDHPGGFFVFDKVDEVISGLKPLPEMPGSVL